MSEKSDRGGGGKLLLVGAVVILLAIATGAGIGLWQRKHAQEELQKPPLQAEQSVLAQLVHRDEPLQVTFIYPFDSMLSTGTASIKRQPDTQLQAREAIAALLTDQRVSQTAGLKDIKVRALYVDAAGNAYVDLTLGQQKDVRASAWEELLAIYSLVNTITQNFGEIKQVRFLMDGKEAQSLAGHMDLSRKFAKRMDLVRQ